MMEGKGLEVIDLGTDVAPETYVQTAIDQGCQIICCSALLTTTMCEMENVVKKANEAGIQMCIRDSSRAEPATARSRATFTTPSTERSTAIRNKAEPFHTATP